MVGSRTSGGETDYLSLIRKAVEYQNKNQISVSEGDSVWVVADGDVNYNNPDPITAKDSLLSKARKMADAKGIQIALSIPALNFGICCISSTPPNFSKTTRSEKTH